MSIRFSIVKDLTRTEAIEVKDLENLAEIIQTSDWSPGLFKDGHRKNENFLLTDVMALDIDDGPSLDKAKELFSDFQHLIIPSKSHQKEKNGKVCDRYRVVLILEHPISDKLIFANTWNLLFKQFDFIDKAAKDPARFFYRCPHKPFSINSSGHTISPSLISIQTKHQNGINVVSRAINAKKELSKETLHFLVDGAPDGQWNNALYKAAKDAQQQLWEKQSFVEKAIKITGYLDPKDHATIDSAYKNEPIYEPRGDLNDPLREVILKSHLMIDIKDSSRCFLLNLTNGRTKTIDPKAIGAILNKTDLASFMSTKRIFAAFGYYPNKTKFILEDSDNTPIYNCYQAPFWKEGVFFDRPLTPEQTLPPIYETFLRHLTGNDDPSFEYLLDWIANSLQGRNLTILTAIGEEGIGKGILGELLEDLHGKSNFVKVRDNVFKEKFNGPLENKTLVYVDEIKIESRESLDRIKDVVNWQIEIEKKGEDQISIRNNASFYLSSNSFDAIPIEHGQRRFSVIQLTDEKLKDSVIIKSWPSVQVFVDELRSPENVDKLARFLFFKSLSHNMIDVFTSDRLEDVKEAGLREWEYWLIYSGIRGNEGKTYDISAIQNGICREFPRLKPPGRRKLEELAQKYPSLIRVRRLKDNSRVMDVLVPPKATQAIMPNSVADTDDHRESVPLGMEDIFEVADAAIEAAKPTDPIFNSADYREGQKTVKKS